MLFTVQHFTRGSHLTYPEKGAVGSPQTDEETEVSFLAAHVLCASFVDGAKVECGALERDELVPCLSFYICTMGVL